MNDPKNPTNKIDWLSCNVFGALIRLNSAFIIDYVSDNFDGLFQQSSNSIKSLHFETLFDPKEKKRLLKYHQKINQYTSGQIDLLMPILLKDKKLLCRIRMYAKDQGWIVFIEPTTDPNDNVLSSLHQHKSRWDVLIKNASEGFVLLDTNSCILELNRKFLELMQFKSDKGVLLSERALCGLNAIQLFENQGLLEINQYLLKINEDSKNRTLRQSLNLSYGDKTYLFDITEINLPGQGFAGHSISVKDRTNEVELENLAESLQAKNEQLTELTERLKKDKVIKLRNEILEKERIELTHARNAAEAANKSKSDLLANISHEFRTPLNGIIGLTQLALETQLDDEPKSYLNMIHNCSESLLALVNDLLDLSKIKSKKMQIDHIDFSLRDTLFPELKEFSIRAHEKSLSFDYSISASIPDLYYGDPIKIKQIVVNLLGNAIKFTDSGSIKLSISEQDTKQEKTQLLIKIEDTGFGIPSDKLESIFESFNQADNSVTRTFGGTGLGLSICSEFASAMGGRIWANSAYGKGSQFCVLLPLKLAPKNIKDEAEDTENYYPNNLSPILLVDNNVCDINTMSQQLKQLGFIVEVATSSDQCLERIEHAQNNNAMYECTIISDQLEGGGNKGSVHALLDRIDQLPGNPNHSLKHIILTKGSLKRNLRCQDKYQIVTYLLKPVLTSEFKDILFSNVYSRHNHSIKKSPLGSKYPLLTGHLLIVDDNPFNLTVACKMTESFGLTYEIAENGDQAVKAFQTRKFDLILLDLHMPVKDGYTAAQEIRLAEREQQNINPICIIAVTADVSGGIQEKIKSAGINSFIHKPFRKKELYEKISGILSLELKS